MDLKKAADVMAMDTILTQEDFKKLEKLKFKRRLELQLGRKRTAEEAHLSMSEDDSDTDDEINEDPWDGVNAESLKIVAKSREKAARLAKIYAGRVDRASRGPQSKERKGGSTNMEKTRKKPLMMVRNVKARKTINKSAQEKLGGVRKHMKNLKKSVGGAIKRRRK